MMANLRLVLGVDVQPGDEHTPKHGQAGLWSLLHRIGRSRWPALLRGDVAWGIEPVMARAEQQGLAYLFRLRMTTNVKRALTKMMAQRDWTTAGHGWQGKETTLRLVGWSLVLVDRSEPEQPLLALPWSGPIVRWGSTPRWSPLWTARSSRWASCTATGAIVRTRSMN